MGSGRWCFVLLLAALAASAEPDASVADPLHWSDPRGTASGSRRSLALPVTGDLEEAWHVELKGRIAAPPVHWEGIAYVVTEEEDSRELVGIDLFRGRVLATKRLGPGPATRPVVWDHRVFLRASEEELGEYLLVGKGFNQTWRHRPGLGRICDPVVFENEIYVVSGMTVARLAPGRARPVWTNDAVGMMRGRPAVWGDHLIVLGDSMVPGRDTSLHIYAFSRRDGTNVAVANVAWYSAFPPAGTEEGQITVTPGRIYILPPASLAAEDGAAPAASIDYFLSGGRMVFKEPARLHSFKLSPAVHRKGLIALHRKQEWVLFRHEPGAVLSASKHQPDLFENPQPPTVLGDVVYFGGWAADIETLQILWRIPARDLRFPLVPADRMVLLVDGPHTLRALRERRSRR